ncbi:MAG: hypothetical protein L6N95_01270 [Candidatus Methylarchaceae archaeon HK01B]|nr:hypothetical protein [Candidatus Methylarchaceae archaeon HK01B]
MLHLLSEPSKHLLAQHALHILDLDSYKLCTCTPVALAIPKKVEPSQGYLGKWDRPFFALLKCGVK